MRAIGIISSMALASAMLGAGVAPASAAPVDSGAAYVHPVFDDDTAVPMPVSQFTGVLLAPERGSRAVHVNGDVTLDPGSCARSPVNGWRPYRTFAGFLSVGAPRSWKVERPWVHNVVLPATNFIDRHVELPAGTYEFRAWAVYADPGDHVYRDCGRLTDQLVTVVDRVSTMRGATADDSVIIPGQSTVISFTERITWTDGVITEQIPDEVAGLGLQVRALGTAAWGTESMIHAPGDRGDSTRRTVRPLESVEYRFLEYDQPSRTVTVTVAQPTMGRIVSAESMSDTEVMMGATVEISAALQTQYTDGVWRPSPVGTSFEVQFLPEGAPEWVRLYRDATEDLGLARLLFPVDGAGRYRITSGGGVGASIAVAITQPTSRVAIEPPDLPTQVSPGLPIDLSVPIEIQYSDGIYRPAPDGTAYRVQFAASGPRAAARWTTVVRGKVRDGVAAATIRPKKTGYWRVTMASAASSAVLVRVRAR